MTCSAGSAVADADAGAGADAGACADDDDDAATADADVAGAPVDSSLPSTMPSVMAACPRLVIVDGISLRNWRLDLRDGRMRQCGRSLEVLLLGGLDSSATPSSVLYRGLVPHRTSASS